MLAAQAQERDEGLLVRHDRAVRANQVAGAGLTVVTVAAVAGMLVVELPAALRIAAIVRARRCRSGKDGSRADGA